MARGSSSGLREVSRLAPLSGLTTAVLFAAGNAIWGFEQPDRDASSQELVSFYEDTSTEIVIGATLSLLSILFFVWFGSVLRDRLAAAEGRAGTGLPLVAFGGTVLAAAVGLGAETINMAGALSAKDGQLTPDTAQAYFDISYSLGAPAAGVALAMVALPIAVIALRTGRPVGRLGAWTSAVIGVALLTPVMLTPWFGLPVGLGLLLLAGLSIRLYRD